jgi:hypothetical protein
MIATSNPITRADRQEPARRSWRTRPTRFSYDAPAEVLAVLQHARAIIEAGWVQNRWTAAAVPSTSQTASPATASVADDGTADGSVRACVVAAVALAVRARDPRADLAVTTGPAVAHLWDAVHGDRRWRAAGRAAPHEVRIGRMRELARWNDEPGRTRADVVAALDRAAAQVVAMTVDPART